MAGASVSSRQKVCEETSYLNHTHRPNAPKHSRQQQNIHVSNVCREDSPTQTTCKVKCRSEQILKG